MKKVSCGLLMFHRNPLKFFLVHPGGPFFKNKDEGYWTIPKGEPLPNEDFLTAAIREFKEETGIEPVPPFIEIGEIKQKGGKTVKGWAFETDKTNFSIISNTFEIEWPPKTGRKAVFPEVDRADFFSFEQACKKINSAQIPLLERLILILK